MPEDKYMILLNMSKVFFNHIYAPHKVQEFKTHDALQGYQSYFLTWSMNKQTVYVSKWWEMFNLLWSLYPIHSDTECLDTASGLTNKQDTCMVSAFSNILWRLSTTFSYGKYARYFYDIMRNDDNLQTFVWNDKINDQHSKVLLCGHLHWLYDNILVDSLQQNNITSDQVVYLRSLIYKGNCEYEYKPVYSHLYMK